MDAARPKVLVVDDDVTILRGCETVLSVEGFDVKTESSPLKAIALLGNEAFDLLLTDLRMDEMGGLELLERARAIQPDLVAVVMTGYASVSSAVEAMRLGASDYLPKPYRPAELLAVMRRAWDRRRQILMARDAARGRVETFMGLVGSSPRMQEVFEAIRKVAPTDTPVLLVGEPGVGKRSLARAIHEASGRSGGRFVPVDCGAPGSLSLEAEVFGLPGQPGLLDMADKGTAFFDEISNITLECQGRLLRLLEEKELMPVGGGTPWPVNIRAVFSTTRDLEQMVRDGAFREGLLRRISVFPIYVPPLRDRKEDLIPLAFGLLRKVCDRTGRPVPTLSDETLEILKAQHWPGNVAELESVIEWTAISCDGDLVTPAHLPRRLTGRGMASDIEVPSTNAELVKARRRLKDKVVADLEREFVLQALARSGGNVTRAAALVGMQRPNFQAMMRKHGVKSGRDQ